MKIQLNTNLVPMFSGTYESMWEVVEYNEDGTEEVNVDYEHKDLMRSIAEAYRERTDYIKSELNCPFIKKLQFDGTFYSPREYNFKTDELDFTITVDYKEMLLAVKELKDDKAFSDFLHDHYATRDGFWSYTPDNYRDILLALSDKNNNEFKQSVGALIRYLGLSNIKNHGGYSIEEMVYEDWQSNGYGGLDYKVVDRFKLPAREVKPL